MQKAEQFRQYAEEAMRWAYQSKSQKEKEALIELATHMDASRGAERAHLWRQPQSNRGQGRVRPPADAPTGPVLRRALLKNTTERMVRKRLAQALRSGITLGAILLCANEAALAEQSPAERRGLRFVRLHCAQCHAIDKTSASPLTIAPSLRALNLRYGVADLQRPLAEGIHPTMPLFRLTPGEIGDVMAYLRTLR